MIAWSDVLIVAPELSTLASGTQTAILAYVALQMNVDAWGSNLDMGLVYLAAHMATMTLRRGTYGGGAVTGETVGSVSRQYAAPMMVVGPLGSTSYGMEYERLLLNLPAARFEVA